MSNQNEAIPLSHVRQAPIPRERCGMALACDLLGDRWTMLIMREAFYGVSRFADLRADLGIPRGVLSNRLDLLVQQRVLERHPYREGKARIRHEYRLTVKGQDLGLSLIALMQWGDRHLSQNPTPLRLTDRKSGDALVIGLVDGRGRAVAKEDVVINIDRITE